MRLTVLGGELLLTMLTHAAWSPPGVLVLVVGGPGPAAPHLLLAAGKLPRPQPAPAPAPALARHRVVAGVQAGELVVELRHVPVTCHVSCYGTQRHTAAHVMMKNWSGLSVRTT